MRFSILASRKDKAGMNIARELEKLGFQVNYTEKEIVYAENIDKQIKQESDFIIFISKHQGAKSKILSIHAPGNWNKAELGGKQGKVCPTSAFILKTFFINLNKNTPANWTSTLECTHHGPYIDKPCLFIEIGSSQQDWKSVEAAKAIAKTIEESIQKINKNKPESYIPAIGIASPHYCNNFNQIQLNSTYALSYIIPNYQFPITKEMLQEAISKTQEKVETAIIDWKGLKGKDRQETLKLLNELGLKILRTSEIEKK